MSMEKTFSLKDQLFNKEKVTGLAHRIKKAWPAFNDKKFIHDVVKKFPELELKERIVWIREKLEDQLPSEYQKAVTILLKSLPEPCDPEKTDDDFGDFIYSPFNDFVATHGCTKKNLAFSLNALKEITQRFSAEDAIRPFINTFEKETLATLKIWTTDPHYHVRRLVSEGTRPKLPWAKKITLDYKKAIPLLDALHTDPTRFVTRSVANHMNDISKIDADLCIKTLKKWKTRNKKQTLNKELDYIIRHSLRTLVKKGHPNAMILLGYSTTPKVEVSKLKIKKKKVHVGSAAEFSFDITATNNEKLVVDYTMSFQNKSGRGGEKVYKIKQIEIKKGETVSLHKRHPFKKNMTTRTFHKGTHTIAIQINGKKMASTAFELITE